MGSSHNHGYLRLSSFSHCETVPRRHYLPCWENLLMGDIWIKVFPVGVSLGFFQGGKTYVMVPILTGPPHALDSVLSMEFPVHIWLTGPGAEVERKQAKHMPLCLQCCLGQLVWPLGSTGEFSTQQIIYTKRIPCLNTG